MSQSGRLAVALTVALVMLATPAAGWTLAPSSAPATPTISVHPRVAPPSTDVRVKGHGFGPSEKIRLRFDGALWGQAITNGSGDFAVSLTIPASALPGEHTVKAVGRSSGRKATATVLVNTDWAQFQFNPSHSGFNRYENVLTPSTVGGLRSHWYFGTGFEEEFDDSLVFRGTVFVGAFEDVWNIYALDASTGKKRWTAGGIPGAVAVGVVYARRSGALSALDASTGKTLWTFNVGSGFPSRLAAIGHLLYFGDEAGTLYAVNATTGEKVWSFGTTGAIREAPAVRSGQVYVAPSGAGMYAVDRLTGVQVWHIDDGLTFSAPGASADTLYAAASDHNVYAFNLANGTEDWHFGTRGIGSAPALAEGTVFANEPFGLHALDAVTGAERWSFRGDGDIPSVPAVADGVVYMADRYLYALDATNGMNLWESSSEDVLTSEPVVANGVVYVGSDAFYMAAFGL